MVGMTIPLFEKHSKDQMDESLSLLFSLSSNPVLHINEALEILTINKVAHRLLPSAMQAGAHLNDFFSDFSLDWLNKPEELRWFKTESSLEPASINGLPLHDKQEWVIQFQLLSEKFVTDEKLCRFLCDASGQLHWGDRQFPQAFDTTLNPYQGLSAEHLFEADFNELLLKKKAVVLLKSQSGHRRTARIHLNNIPFTIKGLDCYLGSILFIEQSAKDYIDPSLAQILYEQTSELAKVGGWYLNLGTGETHFTEVTRQIHELEPEEELNVGSGLDFFATSEARAEIRQKFGRLVQHGEPYNIELPFITAKGRSIWIRTMGKAVVTDGVTTAVYGAIQDVSKEHHSMEVLSKHNERLSNFAHIVSHNLRSHTANLSSLIEAIELETSLEEKLMLVELLKVPSQHLNTTISALNQVVTMPRTVESGLQPCSVLHHLKQSLNVLGPQIEAAGVDIRLTVDEKLQVLAVPAFLEGICHNLITNAVKYRDTNRPAVVEISLQDVGNEAKLTVRDNGLGIDMSKYGARIFGMYKTFHGNKDALGLGLFMTKNQVEGMNGKIDLESEVGVGTIVQIMLQKA